MSYLVRVRCAHKDNGAFLWHLPTTPRVHFSEEELHQDRERPQEGIVHVFIHDGELLALRVSLLGRHGGYLNHEYAADERKEYNMRRRKGEVGVASYDRWCVSVRGRDGECDRKRGVTRHEMRARRNRVADDEAALEATVLSLVSIRAQTQTCCHAPSRSSTFSM